MSWKQSYGHHSGTKGSCSNQSHILKIANQPQHVDTNIKYTANIGRPFKLIVQPIQSDSRATIQSMSPIPQLPHLNAPAYIMNRTTTTTNEERLESLPSFPFATNHVQPPLNLGVLDLHCNDLLLDQKTSAHPYDDATHATKRGATQSGLTQPTITPNARSSQRSTPSCANDTVEDRMTGPNDGRVTCVYRGKRTGPGKFRGAETL